MRKVFAFALMLAGVLTAGYAYAWSDSSSSSSSSSFDTSSMVSASVVDKSGDTVRLYAPEGNKVLCEGDHIPVYGRTIESRLIQPSSPWEATESPGYIFGRTPSTFGRTEVAKSENMNLIGEVRVDSLVGDNYADGTLIVGDASSGDIASKPSEQCLPQPGMLSPES